MPPRRKKQNKLLVHAKWFVIGGVLADVACLGVGYYYYQQLKKSPEFRFKIYNYDQRFLDIYYKANEKYGDGTARQHDFKEWGIDKIESFSFIHF